MTLKDLINKVGANPIEGSNQLTSAGCAVVRGKIISVFTA